MLLIVLAVVIALVVIVAVAVAHADMAANLATSYSITSFGRRRAWPWVPGPATIIDHIGSWRRRPHAR